MAPRIEWGARATRKRMDAHELLGLLADGEFHSGERLGAAGGLTRAAVWKHVRKLEKWGLQVEACSGRGYRLSQPIELLEAEHLHAALADDERFELERVDIFTETDSTNRFLMENPPSRSGAARLCLAEWQSAGRGRLARRWVSPLGSGICMSVAWVYEGTPRNFTAMSLAAGAAIAEAIAVQCALDVQLKWPNDIVWNGRKLGGILVESRIEAHGLCHVVIGIGLNVAVPDDVLASVSDWHAGAVDIRTATNAAPSGRNALATRIAAELGALLSEFGRSDPTAWLRSWRSRDYLRGRTIRVGTREAAFDGIADGIDDDGALIVVDAAGRRQRVLAGEASVRPQ